MLTETEIIKLGNGEYFNKSNKIGNGVTGIVYKINDKYVVKKFKYNTYYAHFRKELEATILLSNFSISPKVVYHSNPKVKSKYFVMQRLDHTLYNMLKNRIFTEYHLFKLEIIINKLNKTKYIHTDLHLNNIMWSEHYKQFYIIDWGYYSISKTHIQKNNYKFVIKTSKYWMYNSKKIYKFFGCIIFRIVL